MSIKSTNFVDQLLLLINKVTKSTHEEHVIGNVSTFIQDLLNAQEARKLHMTYEFYKLFTTLINEISFKQYFNILEIFDNSKLRSHEVVGMRFVPETVFEVGYCNNLFNVMEWGFKRSDTFHNLCLTNNVYCPFRYACSNGRLEIAQFLLNQLRKRLTVRFIEKNVVDGFEAACKNGKANVVEWLLSLEFKNIEYKYDIVNIICDKQYIDVLDVLIYFRPYKLKIVFNADRTQVDSFTINSLQEEKWLQRKLPLLAHYNENVTIFNSIPKDMVQYICQFV
jgi:hypothetical protein